MASPDQCALPLHGMQEREGGGGSDQEVKEGVPPKQHALPAHDMQEWGKEEGNPAQEGKEGPPPKQNRMPFVRSLIQEMGGGG